MKKRIASIFLVLILIMTFIPTTAVAALDTITVSRSGSGSLKKGDSVTITITVPAISAPLGTASISLVFDKSAFEATDVVGGPLGLIAGATQGNRFIDAGSATRAAAANTNGKIDWPDITTLGANELDCSAERIVSATFTVRDTASGIYEFKLDPAGTSFETFDDEGNGDGTTYVNLPSSNLQVEVVSPLSGTQDITGVTAPVKNAAPVTSVTAPAGISAGIDWYKEGETSKFSGPKFEGDTVYLAKITVHPKSGYQFASDIDFTVDGNKTKLTAEPLADGGYVLTKTFPATTGKDATTISAGPTASAITYGQKLSNSTLSGGAANVSGTFAWKTGTIAPEVKDSGTTEYEVVFTPDDAANYETATCKVTLTVNPKNLSSISIIPIDPQPYTGLEIKPDVTVKDGQPPYEDLAESDYSVAYSKNKDVGTADIVISPKVGGNYSFTAGTFHFTIKPADSSITITSAPGKTYDGNVVADPTASATGSTGAVSYTYYTDADCTTETNTATSGAATSGAAPKNAGDYWVKATVAASGNYGSATSAAKKFTISPAEYSFTKPTTDTATINQPKPSGGAATATGVSSETVSGTLSWYTDSGCTASASGNFGTVGNEDLYWKFVPADPNYVATPQTGKVTFHVTALPAQTVTFATPGSIAKTFGEAVFSNAATSTDSTSTITYASDKPAVATVDNSGKVTIKGAGTAIITATAAATSTHAEGQANYTLTVSPKPITPAVTVTGTYTYNGDPITPTYTVEIISGTALPTDQYDVELTDNTNAGTAHLKIKAKAGGNYSFTAVDRTFTIDKKKAPELTAVAPDQFTLFGVGDFVEPIVYGVKGEVLEGAITYDVGGTAHYPNKAAVVAKLKTMAAGASLPLNYHFAPTSANYLGAKTGNFTITVKAKTDVSAQITFPNGTLTYNGAGQKYEKASIDGITAGANPKWTYTYTAVSGTLDGGKPKTAGTYTVTAVYEDDNNYGTKSATLTIVPKKVAIPAADTAVYTYNGAAQTYGIAGTADYTVSGNTQTNANETGHTVTVALADPVNTAWADGTTADKTYTFKIMKATPTGAPTCTKITTSGKTLTDAPLAIGTIAPAGGTLAWDMAAATVVAANTAYGWTYTPADTANYKVLTGSIELYHKSSGGGGGSSKPSYAVTVDTTKNGTVTVSPKSAYKGDTVTITVKPDKGYELDTIKALDKNGDKVKLTEKNGKYTFKMPDSKVEIKATFVKEAETSPFSDVSTSAYYYEAVKWAQKKGITGGIGDGLFGPNQPCTRAQIVTFLWRAAGSPEPKTMSSFSDVPAGSYYAKAVAWAVENGITAGTGDGKFSPNAPCTRGQSVTFLYRAIGTAPTTANGFTDVEANAFCADAVAWAVENGVTNGTSASTFSPGSGCTRAQIVTFLYRAFNK